MDPSDKILSYKLATTAAGVNRNTLLDSEIQRAKALLSDAEHVLDELNGELKALVARRGAQVELIYKYRVALAPHKRLAPELLSEIFLHCLSTTSSYSTLRIPPKTTDAPWLLGQVCAQWRAVSRADPRLWRPAKMSIYDRPHRYLKHACELLPPVARLSVSFIGPAALVTAALVPHLWRIQDLTLRMGIAGYDEFFHSTSPDDFVMLESANFSVIDGASEDITLRWERPAGVFNLASKFRQLKIETAGGFPISKLGIPLGNITSLNISDVKELNTRVAISVLQDCHWLENLDVSFSPHDSDPIESVLYLPRLQSLRVRTHIPSPLQYSNVWDNLSSLDLLSVIDIDSCTLSIILKQSVNLIELHCICPEGGSAPPSARDLRLPCLQKLSLTNVADTWLFDSLIVPSLQELLIQSTQAPLNPLSICDLVVSSGANLSLFWFQSTHLQRATSPPAFRDLLDAIPAALHVENTHSLLDQALLKDIGSGILLPQLEFLRCWPETQDAFLDMAEARAWRSSGTSRPPRTLRQAFGVSQIGARVPRLSSASHLRLGKLRRRDGLVCSLYPPSFTWDDEYQD